MLFNIYLSCDAKNALSNNHKEDSKHRHKQINERNLKIVNASTYVYLERKGIHMHKFLAKTPSLVNEVTMDGFYIHLLSHLVQRISSKKITMLFFNTKCMSISLFRF